MPKPPDDRAPAIDDADVEASFQCPSGRLGTSKPASLLGFRRATQLLAFVFAALFATNGWLIGRAYFEDIHQAHQVNSNLARAVATRVEASVAEAEHALDATARAIERSQPEAAASVQLARLLTDHVARVEQVHAVFLFDEMGQLIAESAQDDRARIAPIAAIRYQDNGPPSERKLLIGPPFSGLGNGDRFVPVTLHLATDARTGGALVAALGVNTLTDLFRRFDIGRGSITLVVNGQYIAREPSFKPSQSFAPSPELLELLSTRKAGTGDFPSPVDGVRRLFSFERSDNYPIIVLVSSSKSEVLGNWAVSSALQSAWLLLLCLLLLKAGRLAQRTLVERLNAEGKLRRTRDALGAANARLAQLAQNDALTGLANRRRFDSALARATRAARRERQWLSLILVDIDDFKSYNDHHGHVGGDDCLRLVASTLSASMRRPEDFVARYGGEEFAIVLPNTDAQGALIVAETVRQSVAILELGNPMAVWGKVTLSVGVACHHPQAAISADELIRRADTALYASKRSGKNRVTVIE